MRHRKNIKRLSRQSAHRKAVLRNQVKSLFAEESIMTTLALAKESRRLAEKLITIGKKNTVAARRLAFSVFTDRTLVKLLFDEITPRFANRAGGYTRIIRLGKRKGDNAQEVILELTEKKPEVKKEKKAEKGKKATPAKKDKKSKAEKEVVDVEAQVEEKEEQKKTGEDEKGFLGGLKKFLKKDKPE